MQKALFWDFDGTIIHPNESFFESLLQALIKNNYNIPAKQIRDFLQHTSSWNTPEIAYTDKTGNRWWQSFWRKCNAFYALNNIAEAEFEDINSNFKKRVTDVNTYNLYDDARDVLEQCCRMGYKNYILSNNYPELSETIRCFGLEQYFEACFVSSNIGYEKPRKEIFEYALREAGFPECCYMIGDNPVADIKGAKAAGMRTILVHRDVDSDADFRCKSLTEILKIVS